MKRVGGFAMAALAVTVSAGADTWDLTGGVLITHHATSLTYTTDVGDWGAAYSPFAIDDSQYQVTRIDGPAANVIWFVLAAWGEPKIFSGFEFGFTNFNAGAFAFEGWGPCFPPGGGLELPTAAWPGPNEGTACVWNGTAWSGNYVPIYYFGGYAYGAGQAVTTIQVGIDPPTSAIGFTNAQSPAQTYPVAVSSRGGLGINQDGVRVHPTQVDPERACCNPVSYACTIKTEADCAAAGGIWRSELASCTPNPCIPTGACCWGTTIIRCDIYSEAECLAKPHPIYGHGVWQGSGVPCDPNPCLSAPERVCCLPDNSCQILISQQCANLGGTWHESYSSCSEAHCDALGACCVQTNCSMVWEEECKVLNGMSPTQPFVPGHLWHPTHTCEGLDNPCYGTPVQEASWGRIKSLYR